MHIPDGILTAPVIIGGYITTTALTALALRQIKRQPDPEAMMPKAALLTAAFFVASWIHIPVPPTSVHLVLNGLLGVVLGWYAMPAILIGLFLQAVLFQHGGLTTLGVNATIIGLPALAAFGIFRLGRHFSVSAPFVTSVFAFFGGALGLGLGALLAITVLLVSIPAYLDVSAERTALLALGLAHVPLALIEGALTALIIGRLLRVRPDVVEANAPAR